MTWPIVVVVVLLVGLPLGAVWWSRRRFWSRLRPGRDRDVLGEVVRRHGLGPAAIARVEDAVLWGKRVDDPRERAAVVDLARASLPRPPSGRWATVVVVGAVAYLVVAVAGAVWATVQGRWDDVPWTVLLVAGLVGVGNGPRLAIRRNTD
ncbi:hypothetical protein [Klenkia terrae]|uniref:Uncharacterized protein n=1 Tax=Klenkia terrae TaxID=1052259 RepID=A0ABU8ECF4_9ACTN